MDDLVIIKVRDQDPLTANRTILTANSPVFNRLINEFLQTEIDMEDFDTEVVVLFLVYLASDNKRIDFVERQHFRELHKMIIVFEVEWMRRECHRYFRRLIRCYGTITGLNEHRPINGPNSFEFTRKDWKFEDSMVVLEECKFMVSRWGSRFQKFIDLFVYSFKLIKVQEAITDKWSRSYNPYKGWIDPTGIRITIKTKFLDEFMSEMGNFTPLEVDVLLQIVRYHQIDLLITLLLKLLEIDSGEELIEGSVLKHLLENLNLSLCRIREPDLYQQIVDILKTRSQSLKDMKFVYGIVAESAKLPLFREIKSIYDLKNFDWMRETVFVNANDVLFICKNKNVGNVHAIVDFILHIILKFEDSELPPIDPEVVLRKLEDICRERGLFRAHRPYVERSLNFFEFLRQRRYKDCDCPCQNLELPCDDWTRHNDFHPNNMEYVRLLNLIKKSRILSSQHEDEIVYLDKEKRDAHMYYFEHPGVPNCSRKGKCGFIIKTGSFINSSERKVTVTELHRDDIWSSKEAEDRVHCHDIISPEYLSLNYIQFSGHGLKTKHAIDDRYEIRYPMLTCALPYPLYKEYESIITNDGLGIRDGVRFVMYNVSDYLAAKKSLIYE